MSGHCTSPQPQVCALTSCPAFSFRAEKRGNPLNGRLRADLWESVRSSVTAEPSVDSPFWFSPSVRTLFLPGLFQHSDLSSNVGQRLKEMSLDYFTVLGHPASPSIPSKHTHHSGSSYFVLAAFWYLCEILKWFGFNVHFPWNINSMKAGLQWSFVWLNPQLLEWCMGHNVCSVNTYGLGLGLGL